jgi:methylmalonyl-CoA mutase cobalamin-binding subunit
VDNEKRIGLFRLRLNGILQVFASYGMDVYIPQAVEEIVRAAQETIGQEIPSSITAGKKG